MINFFFLSCFIKLNKTWVWRGLLHLILKMRGKNSCWNSEKMNERFNSLFYVLERDFIFLLMSFFAWNGSLKKTNIAIQWIQAQTLLGRYCTEQPVDSVFFSRVFGSISLFCACLSFVSKSWETAHKLHFHMHAWTPVESSVSRKSLSHLWHCLACVRLPQ